LPRTVGVDQPQRDGPDTECMVIHHVKPFTGHLVHAVHIDRLQKLSFNQWYGIGPAIGLPRSRVNDACLAVLVLACLKDSQWRDGVHLQIFKGLLHRFDMTDVPGEIEYVSFVANKLAHQIKIGAIAFDNLDIVLNRFDIEAIGSASRMEGIEKCHRCAVLNQANRDVAPDEAEAAGD
jgi:hypothetical protein